MNSKNGMSEGQRRKLRKEYEAIMAERFTGNTDFLMSGYDEARQVVEQEEAELRAYDKSARFGAWVVLAVLVLSAAGIVVASLLGALE